MAPTATVLKRVSLDIEGMTCNACVARLERALSRVDGIETVAVNLPLEKATLVFDTKVVEFRDLKDIVERTGFDVGVQSREYFIDGLSDPTDIGLIEAALYNVSGVTAAEVNFSEERVRVSCLSHNVSDDSLKAEVSKVGFTLLAPSSAQTEFRDAEKVDDRERLLMIVACLISIPFLVQMIAQFAGWDAIHMMPAAEVVLATPLQFIIGARFYRSAYNALRGRSANMDVLVVLGTSAAYFFSWYLLLSLGEAAEGELYFEASALILTFVLLGKRLEHRAKRATLVAIRQLMDLRPRSVRIQNEEGTWEQQPIGELRVGTTFELRPGDRISADGVVQEGVTTVDEAFLTGESSPITKQTGDMVFEGSLNVDGRIVVECTALGEDGTLAKIVRTIENAQTGKIAVQRLVDRVSSYFVPVILAISLGVFAGWLISGNSLELALISAVSVLVIACPCALGLATPTAIMTGTGAAARAGILYKDIQCIEEAQRVTVIAFDKTGTLTSALPILSQYSSCSDYSADSALQIAASIQSHSEHPIASAFVDAVESRDLALLDVSDFRNHVAEGVEGSIDERTFYVGNLNFLRRKGLVKEIEGLDDEIYLFDSGSLLARFTISDNVRSEAQQAIASIHREGMSTVLLSGDSREKTSRVADAIGISDFHARLTPDEKVSAVDEYIGQGQVVAMVGDGVNDAPALARAQVGIAMSSGTDVSIEVAPITLMRNDLNLISAAIQASRATFRKIKQNLFWAFIYNLVMLPLAAFGFLTPTLAGAAMAMSSVSVVCNSLLLRTWKPKEASS